MLALYAVAGPSILPGDEGALLPAGVDWMEARGELERQDLVQLNHPHGAPMCHPTVAELVKMELPDDSLVGLQRRIMERLEQRGGADIFTLSSLALGAEMGERSFQLQQDAGQRALELLDLESKGRIFLERALAVATRELLLPADDERMQQLILEVAEANGGAGHHLAAEELLYQLLDLLPEKGGELQARTRLALGLILETRAEPDRARAWLEQAAEDLNGLQAHKLLTEIYGRLGELLLAQGEETTLLAEMEVWAGRLMEAADQAIPVPWHLLLLETAARYKTGDPEGALDAADRAISSAQEEGSLAGEARARLVQGQLDRVNEQPDRTEEQLARAHILFLRVGDRMGAARCLRALSGQRPSGRELLEAAARDLEQQVKGHRMPE